MICNNRKILITPISKKYKKHPPCSRKDWDEQILRGKTFQQMMWDDSSKNKSKKGDLFIVWHHKIGVTCHLITDIKSSKDRIESWSNNIGQSNRQVLYIQN